MRFSRWILPSRRSARLFRDGDKRSNFCRTVDEQKTKTISIQAPGRIWISGSARRLFAALTRSGGDVAEADMPAGATAQGRSPSRPVFGGHYSIRSRRAPSMPARRGSSSCPHAIAAVCFGLSPSVTAVAGLATMIPRRLQPIKAMNRPTPPAPPRTTAADRRDVIWRTLHRGQPRKATLKINTSASAVSHGHAQMPLTPCR